MNKVKIFTVSGVISALLDLDHIITLNQKNLPVTFYNLNNLAGRPLHLFMLYLVTAIVVYYLIATKNSTIR